MDRRHAEVLDGVAGEYHNPTLHYEDDVDGKGRAYD